MNKQGNTMKTNKTPLDFWNQIDNLLENIGTDYANWNKHNTDERNQQFRDGLRYKIGRKFTKVIEQNRVWGFIANADGTHKGIPHKKGDVFKAAGWSAPAKWARGSIFLKNTDWFTWTGPNYL
jgi:hypothetical protein